MIDSVIILKILNGDEVLGLYEGENEHVIFVKDPLLIQTIFTETSSNKVVLVSYNPFSDDSVISLAFNKEHVTYYSPVKAKVDSYYKKSLNYIKMATLDKEDNLSDDSSETSVIKDESSNYIYKNISKLIH